MRYCYSFNEENFEGDFDTNEAAAEDAFETNEEAQLVHIGQIRDPAEWMHPNRIGADVYERLQDMLSWEVGEASDCFILTPEAQLSLGEAIIAWVTQHGGWRCWAVNNVQAIPRIPKHLRTMLADAANWVCECGERCDPAASEWRWNGQAWEHSHGHPLGHIPATRTPPPSASAASQAVQP